MSEPLSEDEKAQGRPWYDLDNQPHYEFGEEAVERILAAREAKARAEAGEQIIAILRSGRDEHPMGSHGQQHNNTLDWAIEHIAREVTRSNVDTQPAGGEG